MPAQQDPDAMTGFWLLFGLACGALGYPAPHILKQLFKIYDLPPPLYELSIVSCFLCNCLNFSAQLLLSPTWIFSSVVGSLFLIGSSVPQFLSTYPMGEYCLLLFCHFTTFFFPFENVPKI